MVKILGLSEIVTTSILLGLIVLVYLGCWVRKRRKEQA
jgi:hypothetical protein